MPVEPDSPEHGPSTAAVHAGEPRRRAHDAITPAIVHSATYPFEDTAALIDFQEGRVEREEYGRYGNPTIRAAEAKLAALESPQGEAAALLCPSGMSAITTTILAMVPSGGHIILTDDCYRRTRQFVQTLLARLGVEHTVVPAGDYAALAGAVRPGQTRLIISESPTNPYLRVADLPQVVAIARQHRVKTLIDATFATPYNLRPLDHGIDLVVHSCTKYMGGHNDLLAGVVIGKPGIVGALRQAQGILGGICDPHSAYLLIRGVKTFALRMERHNSSGMAVARFLESHPRVARVHYPGLPSHPDHAVAVAQMRGFGGVVSFEIEGGLDDTARFIDRLRIPYIAPSLGGVESLVEQPALMSFYELTSEQRMAVGMRDNLVRLSCGIEDIDDLIADLKQAL
ncbi:aminotransferase class I/II-fold pyridoxal phosphate-dependent enzyme [Oscillochloris sp. ZM17-4]|uniref:trans-sulfuration enzyme family protein n=1 Tax=Oscillochloris sp. ZM17-4 TaxID=2866714 RepID=UPI001C72FD02|nr:aminotransferase class I/II-fold pyridoxal phosphate-dependent enzyme [Oscillochloris sp. ZM17-4]MBX0330354.1 aminotransferase class I/II-fold pyridoxal phosphate-dependent enzyme [Oscillochloris sp. ZM17-4]